MDAKPEIPKPSSNLLQSNYNINLFSTSPDWVNAQHVSTSRHFEIPQQEVWDLSCILREMERAFACVEKYYDSYRSNHHGRSKDWRENSLSALTSQSRLPRASTSPTTPEPRVPTRKLPEAAALQAKAILGNAYAFWNAENDKMDTSG